MDGDHDECEGLVDHIGALPSQGQHAYKKLPFSFRVVSSSLNQILAVILHWVPARGVLLLQDSASSKGRYISLEGGWKRGIKEIEDWG